MLGLGVSGFGTILGAANLITTIITMRAPGMTMWRMPIFTWNTLVTSLLFGGPTGIILASPPLDFHLSDSYFVVAHFHYVVFGTVVFGTVVFAMLAGLCFWWPKFTGRILNERLGYRPAHLGSRLGASLAAQLTCAAGERRRR